MPTIVDSATIGKAIQPIDQQVELVPNYELPNGEECIAVYATRRDYTQFMIELAAIDARLATDMHDVAKDVGPGRQLTFYFEDFQMEADDEVQYPRCEVCGDPIDYCQGHGEIAEAQ